MFIFFTIIQSPVVLALSLTKMCISVFLFVYMEAREKKLYLFFNYMYLKVLKIKWTTNSYIVSLK